MKKKRPLVFLASELDAPPPAPLGERLDAALLSHFGFSGFRGQQREIALSVCQARDTLAVLPTGAGKSLLYQLPALVLPGVALVVSPLRSLMENQVADLRARGVAHVEYLHSDLDREEVQRVMRDLRSPFPATKLLFVTPEKLARSQAFVRVLKDLKSAGNLSFAAVDEAHCASQWGHDFRSSYLQLGALFKHELGNLPVLAVTATATTRVRDDIIKLLGLQNHAFFRAGFNRPNIYYEVRYREPAFIYDDLELWLCKHKDEAGIVYCRKRDACEEVAGRLRQAGHAAQAYHSSIPAEQNSATLASWIADETRIICATVSFGMGINKADVRFVVNCSLPHTAEAFYQEGGRAGRDGQPAVSLLYYSEREASSCSYLLKKDVNTDDPARVRKLEESTANLQHMVDYCMKPQCRRRHLLSHFGDRGVPEQNGAPCCDFCSDPPKARKAMERCRQGISDAPRIQKPARKKARREEGGAEDIGPGTAIETAQAVLLRRQQAHQRQEVREVAPPVSQTLRKNVTSKLALSLTRNINTYPPEPNAEGNFEFGPGMGVMKYAFALETQLFKRFSALKVTYLTKSLLLVRRIDEAKQLYKWTNAREFQTASQLRRSQL